MERNTKIAIGCGGAGCLGLILAVIVCVVLVSAGYIAMPGSSNSNRNENYNATNTNSNSNANVKENSNSSPSTSSSLSDDDKHKLFQAAGMTRDNDVIQRVLRKLGFLTADNTVSDDYAAFVKGHMEWAMKNTRFIQSVNSVEKARAYVDEHMND